jgi:APA family basic amino acid/polyamine antiporter
VGIGIFRAPAVVAANVSSEVLFLGVWLLGGVITLVGALCYAELASTFPSSAGEYGFLRRAYGDGLAFLFAWGRLAVMQSGSIAAVAFVYGDYAEILMSLGSYGSAVHAGIAVWVLSLFQGMGTGASTRIQAVLAVSTVGLIVLLSLIGLGLGEAEIPEASGRTNAAGLALVFVLLTYGGWSEAAYLSGEVRDPAHDIPRALIVAVASVTALYLFANLAYLSAFGLAGLRQADTVAADIFALAFGSGVQVAVAGFVCIVSLSTLNGSIMTGARSIYALGGRFAPFSALGKSQTSSGAPVKAIVTQASIASGLILFGAISRDGFVAAVEYTAPVFWSFMFLIGTSLFILRQRDPLRERPFKVPFYPLTPILFCATSAYLVYASLVYTGIGALVGLAALLAGVPLFFWGRRRGPAVLEDEVE